MKPGRYPTQDEMEETRRVSDKDYLEAIYGDWWKIFIDKEGLHYLEYDKGHIATQMVVVRISSEDYSKLKSDPAYYKKFVRTL